MSEEILRSDGEAIFQLCSVSPDPRNRRAESHRIVTSIPLRPEVRAAGLLNFIMSGNERIHRYSSGEQFGQP